MGMDGTGDSCVDGGPRQAPGPPAALRNRLRPRSAILRPRDPTCLSRIEPAEARSGVPVLSRPLHGRAGWMPTCRNASSIHAREAWTTRVRGPRVVRARASWNVPNDVELTMSRSSVSEGSSARRDTLWRPRQNTIPTTPSVYSRVSRTMKGQPEGHGKQGPSYPPKQGRDGSRDAEHEQDGHDPGTPPRRCCGDQEADRVLPELEELAVDVTRTAGPEQDTIPHGRAMAGGHDEVCAGPNGRPDDVRPRRRRPRPVPGASPGRS